MDPNLLNLDSDLAFQVYSNSDPFGAVSESIPICLDSDPCQNLKTELSPAKKLDYYIKIILVLFKIRVRKGGCAL